MKYHNVIIKCSKEYCEDLHKHLFRLKYYYFIRGKKSRDIINNNNDFCVIIKNDRTLIWANENFVKRMIGLSLYQNLKILNYPDCTRIDKLNRLNKKT